MNSTLLVSVEELCVRTGLPRSRVQKEFKAAFVPTFRRYDMDVVREIIREAREGSPVPTVQDVEHLADRL